MPPDHSAEVAAPPISPSKGKPRLLAQTALFSPAKTVASGLMVIASSKGTPTHSPVFGVIVYIAVTGLTGKTVSFTNRKLISSTGSICSVPPEKPVPAGAGQVYVVPAGVPSGVQEKVSSLQIIKVWSSTLGVGGCSSISMVVSSDKQPRAERTVIL